MLCRCSALVGMIASRRAISMKRFCRRSINNLVLATVSLYPLHSTPFNETITRITQHPLLLYNSSCRSTPVKTGVLLLRQPFQLIGYTCTVAHSSPFMHTKSRCSLHFPYIYVFLFRIIGSPSHTHSRQRHVTSHARYSNTC